MNVTERPDETAKGKGSSTSDLDSQAHRNRSKRSNPQEPLATTDGSTRNDIEHSQQQKQPATERHESTRHKKKSSVGKTGSLPPQHDSGAAANGSTEAPGQSEPDGKKKKSRPQRKKKKSQKAAVDASLDQPSSSARSNRAASAPEGPHEEASVKDTAKKAKKRHPRKEDTDRGATNGASQAVDVQPGTSSQALQGAPVTTTKKKKSKKPAPHPSAQPEDTATRSIGKQSQPAKPMATPNERHKAKKSENTEPLRQSISESSVKKTKDRKSKNSENKSSNKFDATFSHRSRRLANGVEVTVYPRGNGTWKPAKPAHRDTDTRGWTFDGLEGPGEIHFAQDGPRSSHRDVAEDAHNRYDRVLSEVIIKLPKAAEKAPSNKIETAAISTSYCHPDDRNPRSKRLMFNRYPSPESMQQDIESGKLVRGIVRINKRHTSEAYVIADTLEHDIFILGRRDRNRALEGDVVAVRLLDVDKIWDKKKEDSRKKDEAKAKEKGAIAKEESSTDKADAYEMDDVDEDQSNEEEEFDEDKNKPKYCGEIVGILDRAAHDGFAGILQVVRPAAGNTTKQGGNDQSESKSKETPRLIWFKPTDKRVPLIAIPIASAPPDFLERQEQYANMIMTVQITKWPIDFLYPFGKIVSSLGMIGDIATESKAILSDCGIKDSPFINAVVRSLPKTPWKIPNKEFKSRRDLRQERIFTIDPATAKDLDDAVHIKELSDGNFEVGVHIADVSFFVKDNTALDAEARNRGTSTYLVDKVIPMLPSLLCEELCSLNPAIDRLAFSVIWKMDRYGVVLDTWFGRTIIRSCAKLSYDDAQAVIDGTRLPESASIHEHPRDGVEQDILNLFKLSQHMRKRRFENGALAINSVRLCFKLNDRGEPEDVWVYQLRESNRLIEEFMLRANMSVAEKICGQFPDEALLRRHAPPVERRLDEFLKHSETLGYRLDGSSAGNLQASFNAIQSQEVKDVLTTLAIKPMQRAKYFCTGAMDIAKYNHYALNVPLYTHFTSPIRRYADVIVHRQLNAVLKNAESSGYDKDDTQQIALECNRNRDGAKNAQDMSIQLYLAHYLQRLQKSSGPIIRSAVVVQVYKDAFDIIVPEYGIEKRIHVDSLPVSQHKFDATDFTLLLSWKRGVPVATENTEAAEVASNYSDDADDSGNESCPGIPIATSSEVSITPSQSIDQEQGTQLFKVFTKFDVLIQASVARSPPTVNVYLINPFAPMPSA